MSITNNCPILANLFYFQGPDSKLGFAPGIPRQAGPRPVPGMKNITEISVRNDHILALSSEGLLYAWGSGAQHQLGRHISPRLPRNSLIPRQVLRGQRVKYIATGAYHSFAITDDDRVWAWGLNNYGQCGIEGPEEVTTPTVVGHLTRDMITQIAAGEHHSAAITRDGRILMWGRNDCYQLGVGISTGPLVQPQIVGQGFSSVSCGIDHNVAIDWEGAAWSWGESDLYETGQGRKAATVVPMVIPGTQGMVSTSSGGHFSILAGIPSMTTSSDVTSG